MSKNTKITLNDLFGVDEEKTEKDDKKDMNKKKTESKEKSEEIKYSEAKATRPLILDGGYAQRAYYISDEQYTQLKILAIERNTNTSLLVREALDVYLKKEKREIKKV